MMNENSSSRRKWFAIASCVAFFLTGIFLVPGLIRPQPTAPPAAEAPQQPEHPSAWKRGEARSSAYDEVVPKTGDAEYFKNLSAFDCMIAPNETVDIGSSITGLIESIEVERSDFVEAEQVLARLESRVEEAAVHLARASAERTVEIESSQLSYDLGNRRRARANDLYEGETLSLDLRDEIETEAALALLGVAQAEVNHDLAALRLRQAEAALARRVIRSPISGFVTDRLMAPGEVVEQGTILRISQLDPLRVDVILPKHLFGRVKPGDEVEVVPEPPLDQPRTARVSIVDRTLDGASGTFSVRMELPNPDNELPGGLRCQARMPTTVTQPREATDVRRTETPPEHATESAIDGGIASALGTGMVSESGPVPSAVSAATSDL